MPLRQRFVIRHVANPSSLREGRDKGGDANTRCSDLQIQSCYGHSARVSGGPSDWEHSGVAVSYPAVKYQNR